MAQYRYRARNEAGTEVRGTLTAASADRAEALLRANRLIPVEIKGGGEVSLWQRNVLGGGIKTKDLVLFSRQLSSMIRAGVPVLEAVQAMQRQVTKSQFQALLEDIAYDIEGGQSLSATLAKHPETFSLFYVGVVKTGEASGRLSEALSILADYLDSNYVFMRKVRSALMYPVFILTAVIIVIGIMFYFVVPQLVTIFEEANVLLPLPTRMLLGVTNFVQSYWAVLIVVILALAVLLRSYLRTPEGQYTVSSWLLRVPVINELFKKLYLSRLTSVLHTLFSSDVPVIESLKIARQSIGNRVYQRILDETAEAIKDGASISSVWEHQRYIPSMLTTMVGVGERSGDIQQAFGEAHSFFQRDVEEMLNSITVFLEPVLVILLGIGVGVVVAAVLLPIYNLVLVL